MADFEGRPEELATGMVCNDKVGNVKTVKDKREIVTETDYNELNLVKEKRRAGLRLVTNEYDGNGNLRYVTDARGYRIEHRYNKRDLLETTVYPATADFPETSETRTYDGARNLRTVTDEEKKTTSYTYDKENRQTSIELAGERTWNRYDEVGNLREIEKPERNTRTMEHDGLKRLSSVTEGGLTTRFEYDGNNNQRHQYDARNNHVEYTWDQLNRKKEHIRHKGEGNLVTRFTEYDAEGNLKKLIDPKEQVFSYDYDELNRLTDEHFPVAATPYLTLVKTKTEYDGNNNVTSVTETKTDTGGSTITDTTVNTYDNFDRLKTSETRGLTVSYDYDNNGNRTSVTTPSGSTTYTYFPRNWVKTAVAGGTTGFDYYPDGKQKKISYPNGAAVAYSYHPTDRVKTVTNTAAGGSVISGFVYEYDHNGNRLKQTETRPTGTETTGYRYDELDRMKGFTVTRGADSTTTDYTFDGYNRKSETILENGTQTVSRSYDYDETDWLTSVQVTDHGVSRTISYTYDKNGNTIRKTNSTEPDLVLYDYNSSNQMVKAAKGATLLGLYDYNADGLRIRHRNSERGDVDYWYDGKAVIEERKGGSLLAHYRYAGRPLSLLSGGTSQYYHFDALGSTVNLTNAGGSQQAGYFLDPWGHVKDKDGDSVNRQIFTGQEHDENTGLIYFGARYYDPDVARFITEDSYLGEAGVPPSLNRYLYAYSNPTVYIDLEGYDSNRINSAGNPELHYRSVTGTFIAPVTTGVLTNASKDELDRLTEYSAKRSKIPENLKAGANGLAVGTYYSLQSLGSCVVAELSERTTSGVDVSQLGKALYPDDPLRAEMFQRYFDFSKERGAEVAITLSTIRTGGAPSGKGKPVVKGNAGKGDVQPKRTLEPESASKPYEGKPVDDPPNTYRDNNGRLRADSEYAQKTGSFVKDPKTKPQTKPLTKPSHGNNIDPNRDVELYKKYDEKGNFLKWGKSQDTTTRYPKGDSSYADPVRKGKQDKIQKLERYLSERYPGPENKESWAGKRNPNHPNYDPKYVPKHMRKGK